jgi:hypothetical protein
MPLIDALKSPLLQTVRSQNEHMESDGICALWQNRDWVSSLADVKEQG